MDTGTHLVMGLGLAGLSYVDPVVATHSDVATAVFVATVLGSQAPDADGLLRLKGNAVYIRNHRGASHSLPALAFWIMSITLLIGLIFQGLPLLHIAFWTFLAVGIHVFTDLFNTYGTQAGRPFSEKWIAWNIIHIFDPFIFTSHIIALVLWSLHLASPILIFPVLYGLLIGYYGWRTLLHRMMRQRVRRQDAFYAEGDHYLVIPTVHPFHWNVVKQHVDGSYTIGEMKNQTLTWVDQIACSDHPAVQRSVEHPDIASFLYYSDYACAQVELYTWGYEVQWVDVRYMHRKQYPFVAVLLLDHDFQSLDSYVGWLSDTRIRKKLRLNP